jgi:hypothetical protein
VDGTYNIISELLGGKTAWENNESELYFASDGIFEDSWVIHDRITDEYLVWVKEDPYKGDSYGPIGKTANWQLFVDGVAPNRDYYKITIVAEPTCRPTAGPTRAPSSIPSIAPTLKYLCVIVTWNVDDSLNQNVPKDFYGAYYHNDINFPSNNDFSKFPIYPTTKNGKAVFTKKRNDISMSWLYVPDNQFNNYTWVADSNEHTSYLASTLANIVSDLPLFYEFPDENITESGHPYDWSLFIDGAYSGNVEIMIQMSRSLDTCEMFETEPLTENPTGYPSRSPSPSPSLTPTTSPSPMPSIIPTPAPSPMPSLLPSPSPSMRPTSQKPTAYPTPIPTQYPTQVYECINITAADVKNNDYNGVYTLQAGTRNGRAWFSDANTGFDMYYVPAAVMIDHAWVLEGSSNSFMSIFEVDFGSWTEYGQSDEVPPYGTYTWTQVDSTRPSVYDQIILVLEPLENCVPTQSPTKIPTEIPTTSTPAPTTPTPTIIPSTTPSESPSAPPTSTPTSNPTEICRVLVILTPEEPDGTSVFEGSYVLQSVFINGKFQWYNSMNQYYIYFVHDDWMPSSWVIKGDDGLDELAIFDDSTDGHPPLVDQSPDGEEWVLFYWGHYIQKRKETVVVKVHCLASLPPTQGPSPLPSQGPNPLPTPMPSPIPSLLPSPAPSLLPSMMPTPSPSQIPSTFPSPSPTKSPTLPTNDPTPSPSNPPTSYPTFVCPCIVITSSKSSRFNGMYQLAADSFNAHRRWYNYDNLGDLYWVNNGPRLGVYWLISVETNQGYAMITDSTGRWGHTPPIGTQYWTLFEAGEGFVNGGIDATLTLNCTTCAPTPSPTAVPISGTTPSPTTPAPSIMPTPSPSAMPSTLPTPSPSGLPTTLDPTPLSAEPTLIPSKSPTTPPSAPRPTASPSLMPSPSPSSEPSGMPSPSPTKIPLVPSLMPSPSPTHLPTTLEPSASPSLLPTLEPSPMPSTVPTPSPTQFPTTRPPTPQPSAMPSLAPTPMPSTSPSPSPSPLPTVIPTPSPTSVPTVTCKCLVVSDSSGEITDYVGVYRHKNRTSPNSDKSMWERKGDNTQEVIYFSQFGMAASRWVIKASTYGEWAETSADVKDVIPPEDTTWRFKDDGVHYHTLQVTCSQCEETPAPTPDPTEVPTQVPTSIAPTTYPTPVPSIYCLVLNITDLTNGYYTGYFEMDTFSYNGKHKWTDKRTGESLHWADTALFQNEGDVENIWMLGFKEDEGEQDSHFLILKGELYQDYPPFDTVLEWMEYIYNEYSNQSSQVVISCDDTEIPTTSPTLAPSEPICTELFVYVCCDPVYTDLNGIYRAVAHRGGKDMFRNSISGYSIYYTDDGDDSYWSIRSEDENLIWVQNSDYNGRYPSWDSQWDLQNHVLSDLKVHAVINCSESFTPSSSPTSLPTKPPTTLEPTPIPSPMPTPIPSSDPTRGPTQVPTGTCVALEVRDQEGEITKYDGTYSRLNDTKNGKVQWMNYETGADVYWIDRGIWVNTWVIRVTDGDYLMIYDDEITSLHPPLDGEWTSLGSGLHHGDKYQILTIGCAPQPPAPAPTTVPSFSPTCEGNAIYIEDPCDNVTGGAYQGFYNAEDVKDGKKVFVNIDREYEVSYISSNLYAGQWVIQKHEFQGCSEFFVVKGHNSSEIPPENALWDAYGCACSSIRIQYKCNFRISCMHTKAPSPTELTTTSPTPAPVDTSSTPTKLPSSAPTDDPAKSPTEEPTGKPSATPTEQLTTEDPTQSPLQLPTQSPVPYECTTLDLQPCVNITGRLVTFYERSENQLNINTNYYETKLYTEQKGYTFVAKKDMVMYEAGMAFVNLASYQSITVRVFDSSGELLYESDYSIDGLGMTETTGSPRGDYYTFRNMNVQIYKDRKYTVVFIVHCPATKTSRANYPLCAPHTEVYSIDDFGTGIVNVYAYGEDYVVPTESDLYTPFIRICYVDGTLLVQ